MYCIYLSIYFSLYITIYLFYIYVELSIYLILTYEEFVVSNIYGLDLINGKQKLN